MKYAVVMYGGQPHVVLFSELGAKVNDLGNYGDFEDCTREAARLNNIFYGEYFLPEGWPQTKSGFWA